MVLRNLPDRHAYQLLETSAFWLREDLSLLSYETLLPLQSIREKHTNDVELINRVDRISRVLKGAYAIGEKDIKEAEQALGPGDKLFRFIYETPKTTEKGILVVTARGVIKKRITVFISETTWP